MAPHSSTDATVALSLTLAVVAGSSSPLLLLDKDLTVVAASGSFCTGFKVDPASVVGRPFATIGDGEWNVPQLLSLLSATASGYAEVAEYEMNLTRSDGAPRLLCINASKLKYDGDGTWLLLSVLDVSDARSAEVLKHKLLQEKEVLLQELHHRVANSLQIIASVLMQSARKVQSEESRLHLVDAHQRVMSVASLQKQLAVTRMGDVELRPYFTALCESIGASMIADHAKVSLDVTVDDSITSADTSVSLGLIVTELVINALKHAFPDSRTGHITVEYRARGSDWTLAVSDDGVGMSTDSIPAKAGLGTGIVEALARQLGARVDVASQKTGTKVSIVHSYVPVLVGKAVPATRPV